MKKLSITISLLLFTSLCFSQWAWKNPLPHGNTYYSIYFTDANTGYAVGGYGTIYKTINAGTDWVALSSGTTYDLRSVRFTDANNGYVVGNYGLILKTTDAGATWTSQTIVSGLPLYSVYFTDANTGYAVGSSGTIVKTIDAGVTWNTQTSGTSQLLNSVSFTDSNNGFAVGGGAGVSTILKTVNGGVNWTIIFTGTTTTLSSVYFTNTSIGYAVGQAGLVLKTIDAGSNWTVQTSGTTNSFNSVYFTDANTGYIVGSGGNVYKSTDAGVSWVAQFGDINYPAYAVYFINTSTGFIVGSGGEMYKSSNAGDNWTLISNGVFNSIYDVYFSDANTGFAVSRSGSILKTTDAGTTWSEQSSPTIQSLRSVFFTDASNAFAVGDSGTILKTTNGGLYWELKTSGTINNLNSVFFTDALSGYAVGNLGTILNTIDGGNSWVVQNSGVANNLNSVYFTDAVTGYAVGASGILLRTIDGYSWGFQTIASGFTLYSVCFSDVNTGYAAGSGGKIVMTNDGGFTWNTQPSGTSSTLQDIYFFDASTIYAVGSGGTILKYNGTTWVSETSGTSNSLQSVYFTDINTGYAVGSFGTILKYVTPGCPVITQNPISQAVCSGGSVTLSVTAIGTAPLDYTWDKDGTTLAIGSSTYPITNFSSNNAGNYTCFVSNASCGSTSSVAVLTLNSTPTIVTQPANQIINTGGNYNVSVSTYSAMSANFQWYKDGVPILGATNSSYSVNGVTSANAGSYMCSVDNSCGSTMSNPVTLLVNATPISQWTWQNPLPMGNSFMSVYFTDVFTGYAVGGYGMIYKTTNAGTNWTALTSGTTNNLNSIYFTDINTGYAVGNLGTIIKTTDAGVTWITKTSGNSCTLNSVRFANSFTGYAVGNSGTILKTTNGGNTWFALTSSTTGTLNTVYFTNEYIGYTASVVGGITIILKTLNAGATWTQQTMPAPGATIYSIYFTDVNTGYAVGTSGKIIKTTDAGNTWISLSSGTTSTLYSVFFANQYEGYISGASGTILTTSDAGLTWTVQTSSSTSNLRSVFFTASESGFIVGSGGTILSIVAGGSWTSVFSSGSINNVRSVRFYSTTGLAVGDDGTISKIVAGGVWTPITTSGTTKTLRSVCFTDANTAYAVGDSGTIIKTINAGTSWINYSLAGVTNTLYSVYFTDANTGFAVGGYNGTTPVQLIYKTVNAGTTWTQVSGVTNYCLQSVYFTDANTGYAVGGANGSPSVQLILKTINAGVSWSQLSGFSTYPLNSVYFSDANTGYAAGQSGAIIKTIDAGVSWNLLSSGETTTLNSIYFSDSNNGYIAGSGGIILKTTDAGVSWTQEVSGTSNILFSVYSSSATSAYATGISGTIITTGTACTAPVIAQQPVSSTSCSGGTNSVSFSVTAIGTAPTYQWYKNTVPISGATNSTYLISGITATDAGTYACIVTACATSVTSTDATLTVNEGPSITLQPISQTLCSGGNFTVSVSVTASDTTSTFQWQKGSLDISGANNSTFTINGVISGDAGSYTCVVSNSCGSITSNAAVLTVNELPSAIITPASTTTFCVGDSVVLNVNIGTGFTYQWKKNNIDINGAVSTTYYANTSGSYTVVVFNGNCLQTSSSEIVTVNPLPTVSAGNDVNACTTQQITLSGSGSTATYTWSNSVQNGVPFTPVSGTYYVTGTDAFGCQNIDSVVVNIGIAPTAGFNLPASAYPNTNVNITYTGNAAPEDAYTWSFGSGSSVVSGSGQGPYVVKWTTTGQKFVTLSVASNGCTSELEIGAITISNMPTADFNLAEQLCGDSATVVTYSGNASVSATYNWNFGSAQVISGSGQGPYTIYWENDGNFIISLTVVENSNTSLPVFKGITVFNNSDITVAGSTELCSGDQVVLYAPGANNLLYQWQLNGADINGANSSHLVVNTQGSYSVVITNPLMNCIITSNPVTVNVHSTDFNIAFDADHTIDTQPTFDFVFTNSTPSLSDYTFTWLWGDGAIDNDNSSFVFHTYTYNGIYTVGLVVMNILTGCKDTLIKPSYIACNGGSANNFNANITPTGPAQICIGDSLLLHVNATNAQSYQWYNGFNAIIGATSDNFYAKQPGDYRAYVSNGSSNVYTNVFTLLLKPSILPQIYSNGQLAACAHDTIQLSLNINYVSYQWSGGENTAAIDVVNGGYYNVTVTDIYGCTLFPTPYFVNSSLLDTPQICIVLVDSTVNKNLIVWEKITSDLISSYRIYKMNSSAQYVSIGLVPYQNLSQFIDTGSNPAAESNWYKISAVDTCGNESALSDYHRTLHLMINPAIPSGYSLDWQMDYQGFALTTYNLYRKYNDGSIEMFHQVPYLQTSYTDLNPPVGIASYFVAAVKLGAPCNPTGSKDMSGPFSQSLSNIEDNGIISKIVNNQFDNSVRMYPNPATEIITIEICHTEHVEGLNSQVEIINIEGQKLWAFEINNKKSIIDISKLKSGFYTIKIKSEEGITIKKLIKQ